MSVVYRVVWLPALLLCVRFFERLTVAITGPAVVLSVQNSYRTDVGVTANLIAGYPHRYAREVERKPVGLYTLLHTVKTSETSVKTFSLKC